MLSRRTFLKFTSLTAVSGVGLSSYAFGIEPRYRLDVTSYRVTPRGWPAAGRPLRIAAIADTHACEPWMPLSRIEEIVDVTNQLEPDLIVLLGDYVAGLEYFRTAVVPAADWARIFGRLNAPLGVRAILGNHDWWADVEEVRAALTGNGIPVLENDVELIEPSEGPAFWLAGLGDQLSHIVTPGRYAGVDDLPGTLAKVADDRPVVLLAHEPDIFVDVPHRVSLTLSGHTHGGQINLPVLGRRVAPSSYGDRYAYGHFEEEGRHLIISAGLGCSVMPVRFRVPPEIVLVEIAAPAIM
jgi:uncharacterized protein